MTTGSLVSLRGGGGGGDESKQRVLGVIQIFTSVPLDFALSNCKLTTGKKEGEKQLRMIFLKALLYVVSKTL